MQSSVEVLTISFSWSRRMTRNHEKTSCTVS